MDHELAYKATGWRLDRASGMDEPEVLDHDDGVVVESDGVAAGNACKLLGPEGLMSISPVSGVPKPFSLGLGRPVVNVGHSHQRYVGGLDHCDSFVAATEKERPLADNGQRLILPYVERME